MKHLILALIAISGLAVVGCKSSHEEGVTSNLREQWTNVMADTAATTTAAKSVLMDDGLKDVTSSSTAVDGVAMAKKADGTKITVNVKKQSDTVSQVSVVVGTLGSPAYGAELAKKIKMAAEGH